MNTHDGVEGKEVVETHLELKPLLSHINAS